MEHQVETPTDKPKLWTKNYILVFACRIFTSAVFNLYAAAIPSFAIAIYGASSAEAGACVTSFLVGATLSRFVTGKYVNVFGHQRTFAVSSIIFAIMSLSYLVPMPLLAFFVMRFIHGVVFGFLTTGSAVVVVDSIPPSRLGEGMGFFSVSTCIATAIGPYSGILVMHLFGFTAMFAMVTIYTVLCLLCTLLIKLPAGVGEPTPLTGDRSFHISDYIEVSVIPICMVVLVAAMCYGSTTAFVDIYAAELGAAQFSEYYFVVLAVAMVASQPFVGKILDARGQDIVMIPALILLAFSFVLFSSAWQLPTLLIAAALFIGVGFSSVNTTTQAMSIKGMPPERIGVATSTFFILSDLGIGSGPAVMGSLVPIMGYSGMYAAAGVIVVVTLVLYIIVRVSKSRRAR